MNEGKDQELAQDKEKLRLENLAAPRAASTPNPGPLADVFAPQQDIKVGPYTVRPFYDVDFEYLQLIDHPYARVALGDTKEVEEWKPRGPKAWELFWILTTPVEEVEHVLADGGTAALSAEAKARFGKSSLGALVAVYTAVVKQLQTYAASVVGYGAADAPLPSDDPAEKAKEAKLPPS